MNVKLNVITRDSRYKRIVHAVADGITLWEQARKGRVLPPTSITVTDSANEANVALLSGDIAILLSSKPETVAQGVYVSAPGYSALSCCVCVAINRKPS